MVIKKLPKQYNSIEVGGKEDGLPEGSIKTTLGNYFKQMNIVSIEPTRHPDEKLLVFHRPNEHIEHNLNKMFQKIGENKGHPLNIATE